MATTAVNFGNFLIRHLGGRFPNSALVTALKMLNVATDGTQEATKFITTDTNTNQGVMKTTALHIGATSVETQVNATPAEINQGADMSVRGEELTSIDVMAATDNGKTFFLNATNEFQTTLPLLASALLGFHCKFIVKGAASTNDYTIIDHASDTSALICNGITESETDTNDDNEVNAAGDVLTFEGGSNESAAGDWIDVYSDGTKWYITGNAAADGGIAVS